MSLASDFSAVHDGHVRLATLRMLAEAPRLSANDSVLQAAMEAVGLACTRDQMRGHLAWLEEQRLVTLMALGSGLAVATITERGGDVAAGRAVVPGVKRPGPKGD